MAAMPTKLESLKQLLFEGALYAVYDFSEKPEVQHENNIRAFCPKCNDQTIFKRLGRGFLDGRPVPNRGTHSFEVLLTCAAEQSHMLRFNLLVSNQTVMKYGQYPSAADIAQVEFKSIRKYLGKEDARELHCAIGLASHDVGIGSFVYIRRVFERLIQSRFHEFSASEGWSEAEFKQMRMDKKVSLLRNHLPDYLVKNASIYGILSKGIHELEEQECLQFFEVAKTFIFAVLKDDHAKKEELTAREDAEKAIQNFSTKK